jgi:hypothetical protein
MVVDMGKMVVDMGKMQCVKVWKCECKYDDSLEGQCIIYPNI